MELTTALKALADDNRLLILRLLGRRDYCVRALARQLGISQAAVSQHLKVLRQAGLVSSEKRGYFTHYRTAGTDLMARLLCPGRSGPGIAAPLRGLRSGRPPRLPRGQRLSHSPLREILGGQYDETRSHLRKRPSVPALRPL